MSRQDQESVSWIRELVAGDDLAVGEFWEMYGQSLQRLAASRMTPALQRRVGPDDIVQSVCRTFFRRSQDGQFELNQTADLWRLLCAITVTKVKHHARFHYQEKRRIDRERDISAGQTDGGRPRDYPAADPTPEEVVEFADEMERLFDALDDEERQFVQLQIDGLTQTEIAAQLGCSERTVRRLLSRVRQRWESLLDHSLHNAPR